MPHLLSLLAFDNPKAPVRGLDTFPKANRTPLAAHRSDSPSSAWSGSAPGWSRWASGTGCADGEAAPRPEDRPTLMAVAAAGPAAFLANELGWLVSELGRQPWIVYGVFRTSSGITSAPGLGATFTAFTLLYVGLTALTVWSVRRIARRAGGGCREARGGTVMSLPAVASP